MGFCFSKAISWPAPLAHPHLRKILPGPWEATTSATGLHHTGNAPESQRGTAKGLQLTKQLWFFCCSYRTVSDKYEQTHTANSAWSLGSCQCFPSRDAYKSICRPQRRWLHRASGTSSDSHGSCTLCSDASSAVASLQGYSSSLVQGAFQKCCRAPSVLPRKGNEVQALAKLSFLLSQRPPILSADH